MEVPRTRNWKVDMVLNTVLENGITLHNAEGGTIPGCPLKASKSMIYVVHRKTIAVAERLHLADKEM